MSRYLLARRRPGGRLLGKRDYEALASFRYALRRFSSFSERAARAAGIEPAQHQALLAVKGFAGRNWVTIGELAERLQIRHHSAVGLVDRMVAARLVRREPAREDRRRVHVVLSARGEKLLARLSRAHRRELHRWLPDLRSLLRRLR